VTVSTHTAGTGSAGVRWRRIATLLVVVTALFLLGRLISDLLVELFRVDLSAGKEVMLHRVVMLATVGYIVLMAIPFMPGVEIGLSMMVLFGGKIAFLVYFSTVIALTVAYVVGRFLPTATAARAFGLFGLQRPRDFMNRLAPMSPEQRLQSLLQDSPDRWGTFLIRHRYLLVALLLNIPGNIVIGGGGGIAMIAGMTRLFSFPLYLLTVALAVAPVPLIVSFTA